jgi:hypothetical protein
VRDRHRLLERKAFPELNGQSCDSPCALSRRRRRGPSPPLHAGAASPPVVIEIDTSPRTEAPAGPRGFRGRGAGNPRDFSRIARDGSVSAARRTDFFFLDRREGSPHRFSTRTPWATRPALAWPAAAATAAADFICLYARGCKHCAAGHDPRKRTYQSEKRLAEKTID